MFRRSFLLQAAGLVALLLGGCVVTVDPIDAGTNGDGEGAGADEITIRIVNNSNTGLDPEIYLASGPVTRDQLFTASRKYTDFGVLGLGVIAAHGSDSFTVPCSEARVVGTKGGSFGDKLTEPEGHGTERILSQDVQFFCDERITIFYVRAGGGFTTAIDVN
jgi:hypothetical protein